MTPEPTLPKPDTQAARLLGELLAAEGEWISGRYFLHQMYLSQYHARIHDLENRYGWTIEHSEDEDEFGFKSYRIVGAPVMNV